MIPGLRSLARPGLNSAAAPRLVDADIHAGAMLSGFDLAQPNTLTLSNRRPVSSEVRLLWVREDLTKTHLASLLSHHLLC